MPFHLAMGAEARQKIIQEVKRKPNERLAVSSIMDLKEKRLSQAKAMLIEKRNL